MAFILEDNVVETSTTTGTGAYTLAGAVVGKQSFAVIGTGNTTIYRAGDGTNWEVGLGTWTTPNQLTRGTIRASSNGGLAVNWGAGTRTIKCVVDAQYLMGPAVMPLDIRTFSAVSQVDFVLDAALYDVFEFHLHSVRASVDGGAIQGRTSSDGGALYDNVTGSYDWHMQFVQTDLENNFAANVSSVTGPSTSILFTNNVGNTSDRFLDGTVRLYVNSGGDGQSRGTFDLAGVSSVGARQGRRGVFFSNNGVPINRMRFLSVGNTISGKISMYGWVKAFP